MLRIVFAYNWEIRNTGNGGIETYLALQEKREERDKGREGCDRREGRLGEGVIRMHGVLGWGEGRDGEKIWNSKFCGNEC